MNRQKRKRAKARYKVTLTTKTGSCSSKISRIETLREMLRIAVAFGEKAEIAVLGEPLIDAEAVEILESWQYEVSLHADGWCPDDDWRLKQALPIVVNADGSLHPRFIAPDGPQCSICLAQTSPVKCFVVSNSVERRLEDSSEHFPVWVRGNPNAKVSEELLCARCRTVARGRLRTDRQWLPAEVTALAEADLAEAAEPL
jgi:hypothetical protein